MGLYMTLANSLTKTRDNSQGRIEIYVFNNLEVYGGKRTLLASLGVLCFQTLLQCLKSKEIEEG